jgi:hypothetical protein
MFKKIAAMLLSTILLTSAAFSTASADQSTNNITIKKGEESDNVVLLQLRLQDLGYYDYKITGFFGDFTMQSLEEFQKVNNITTDGIAGEKTLNAMYSNSAVRKPVEPRVKPTPTTTTKTGKVKYGAYLDWFKTVQYMWKKGMVCKVVDFDTGISYYMKRVGGAYHSDAAPVTKADTAKLKKTYGGSWSWDRRAVIVYIGGIAVAASTNGMPHGSTGVPGNGMNLADGHLQQVCIHFVNSRTHIHNMIDPAHQYEIRRAAGKPNKGGTPAQAEN